MKKLYAVFFNTYGNGKRLDLITVLNDVSEFDSLPTELGAGRFHLGEIEVKDGDNITPYNRDWFIPFYNAKFAYHGGYFDVIK